MTDPVTWFRFLRSLVRKFDDQRDIREQAVPYLRRFAIEEAKRLLATAAVVLGFVILAHLWSAAAVEFVIVAAAAGSFLLPTQMWFRIVSLTFVGLMIAPRWLVPDVVLTGGRFLSGDAIGAAWSVGALAAMISSGAVMTVIVVGRKYRQGAGI
jgi:hypothetical protein